MDNKSYSESSIRSLKGAEQVRLRPAVIFGTNDEHGAAHGIYEIIANAIDEAREGYGNRIKVSIFNDGSVIVEDNGRGVPMGWNQAEGKYNWELIYATLYASGKYDSGSYSQALGLNGLGATAMQYASEYMEVYSTYGGKTYIMKFAKGVPVGKLREVPAMREGTGTIVKFKPDAEVFIGIKNKVMPPEYYVNLLRRQAMLLPGLEIVLYHEAVGKDIVLSYKEGIIDFMKEVCDRSMISKPLYFESSTSGTDDPEQNPEPYKLDMKLVIDFTRKGSLLELYHNASHLYEGGVTMDALKYAMVKAFEDHGKEIGKLSKSDKLQFKDIEMILMAIGETNAPGNRTFFKNQTKAAINNPFIKGAFAEFVYFNVRTWLKNDKQSEKVFAEVLINKEAREEADKVSKKVVASLSKGINGFGNKPAKFVPCKSNAPFEREVYIVEGDSALGACKLSRNADFQAIMPVRGKIMNCLKKDLTEILGNDIIRDLLRVFGCGIEIESDIIKDLPKFDINKLEWGKIIICTDADLDGMQIRCLVITMLYRLLPSLLKAGKVYIAETPLFEIRYKKDTRFAYNEAEKNQIIAEFKANGATDNQISVQRSKGLGENDPEMMSISTMNPLTRRLVSVDYPENDTDLSMYFEALLGNDITMRKMFIQEYFKYLDTVEVE